MSTASPLTQVALAWLAACAASTALAQQAPPKTGPALNWTRQPGAESCIASVELAERIEARVKKKIFVAAPEAIVAVEGYVAPDPSGGFRASIALSDGQGVLYGSRELTTKGECGELTDGLVFVIAVTLRPQSGAGGIELPENVANALDALFGAEPTEPDPSAFPSEPARASQPPDTGDRAHTREPTAIRERAEAEPTSAVYLEVIGAAQLGLQPVGSFGAGLGARLQTARVGSFSVHGVLFVQTTRTVKDRTGPSAIESETEFTAQLVALGYCAPALLQSSTLALEACAAGRLGSMSAQGVSFSSNSSRAQAFGALGLGARLAWSPSEQITLALSVGPELHLGQPRFVYVAKDGETADVYKAGLLGAAAELSAGFALF